MNISKIINEIINKTVNLSLLQTRLWWCLIVIMLLITGYMLWRMPTRLHVISLISADEQNENAIWNDAGLCRWSWAGKNSSSLITQYGWDGNLKWSVNGPSGIGIAGIRPLGFTCSPDGHYVVTTVRDDNKIHIMSWHDGKSAVNISIPREYELNKSISATYTQNPLMLLATPALTYTANMHIVLRITNFGRIWLYNTLEPYCCPITSIIGKQVSKGVMKTETSNGYTYWALYPDENIITNLKSYQNPVMYQFNLNIEGDKITKGNVSIYKNYTPFMGLNSQFVIDGKDVLRRLSGEIIDDSGWARRILPGTNNNLVVLESVIYDRKNPDCRVLNITDKRKIDIHSAKEGVTALCGSKDGKNILTFETNNLKYDYAILNFLTRWKIFDNFFNKQREASQLSLYNKYGHLTAVLPMKNSMVYNRYGYFSDSGKRLSIEGQFAISPDAKYIGAKCYEKHNYFDHKYYYVILGK